MKSSLLKLIPVLAWALLPPAAFADGPGVLKFDEESFEVSEDAGVVVIRVERSQGEDGAVSVQYGTSNGTAVAGQDYTAASGTLSWANGDESGRTFTVPIANDSAAEGSETFQIALSGAAGGASIDSERGATTVRILANDGGSGGGGGNGGDDDPDDDGDDDDDGNSAGTIKFDERDFVALEESGKAVITVERSGGESGAVSVQFSTQNGTATAGQDYSAVSGTLTWGPGDGGHKTFTIPVLDDSASEGSETVRLVLSNPTGASLSPTRGTSVLRIVDEGSGGFDDGNDGNDDGGGNPGTGNGKFEFEGIGFQGVEGQPSALVRIERSRGAQGAVSVQLSTSDLSARAGEDYTARTVTLDWAAGDSSDRTVQIPILQDSKTEGNETVRLTLSSPTGGAVVDNEDRDATLTILDDDGQTTACVEDGDTGCLSANRFKVEVTWRLQDGNTGVGHVEPVSGDSALVWFFSVNNKEMLLKVLDACQPFGSYWVFFAATTNVDFTATVTDTQTGLVKEYKNPANNPAKPVQDTLTFSCNP